MSAKKHGGRQVQEQFPPLPTKDIGNFQKDHFVDSFFVSDENHNGWSSTQNYPAGSQLFEQNTTADAVYLIERGIVKLIYATQNGHQIIVGLRHRNWLIGAPAVILEKLYSFTASTVIQCSLRWISAKDFLHLLRQQPQFSWDMHRLLSQEIFSQLRNVVAMSCMSAEERLEQFLRDLILEQESISVQGPVSLQLPLRQQELAEIIAVTPEHLCRLLNKMEEKGVIRKEKEQMTIMSPQSLLRKPSL